MNKQTDESNWTQIITPKNKWYDIKLKEIQFDSLIFDYEIESNVNGKLDLNLTIDGAFNENAQNFNTSITTDVQKKITGKLNLNNYRFDFTDNGNSFKRHRLRRPFKGRRGPISGRHLQLLQVQNA